MGPKIFKLQQQIAYTLLDKLENDDIPLERATEIAKKILMLIPRNAVEESIGEMVKQVESIPELSGVGFGLVGE